MPWADVGYRLGNGVVELLGGQVLCDSLAVQEQKSWLNIVNYLCWWLGVLPQAGTITVETSYRKQQLWEQ